MRTIRLCRSAEKGLQGLIDLALLLNHIVHELLSLDVPIGGHQRTAAVVLVHLSIAEHVAALHELTDQLHAAFVVRGQIISIREVKGIDVIAGRGITLVDDFKSLDVGRGADGSTTLSACEEFFLGDLLGLGMVREEDDLNLLILPTKEAGHPEEEASCTIFFEGAHGAGRIHHGNDHSIGLRDVFVLPGLVTQIIRTDMMNSWLPLSCVAAQVLHDRSFLSMLDCIPFCVYH